MLVNPKHGWVNVVIGDYSDRASYLTDVPMDCMEAMIYALKNKVDFCVSFDAEGWSFKVIADEYRTFVIEETDGCHLHMFDIDKLDLAKEIYADISKDINTWHDWLCYEDESELTASEKYKVNIDRLLLDLRKVIDDKQYT